MIRPGKWLAVPAAIVILLSSALEAATFHYSELFIASVTMLALVCWFTLLSSCVMAVGRVMA
ncbi:MAG: hypothetical protein KGI33_02095 [Thaumarchaeota archaeon]|nr:hypothetical protein [Nitrososphaerota archaeon]